LTKNLHDFGDIRMLFLAKNSAFTLTTTNWIFTTGRKSA